MGKIVPFGIGLLLVILVSCAPVAPPQVQLESSWPLAVDGTLQIPLGTQVTFTARASGFGPHLLRWAVSGQIDIRQDGPVLNWTFSEAGSFVVEVKLIAYGGIQARDSINVIVVAEPEPVPPPVVEPFSFIGDLNNFIFWFGGGTNNLDGSVNASSGDCLTFDLTSLVTGGTLPYHYYLDSGSGLVEQPGPIFSWTVPNVITTTTFHLTIRVVDANGNSVERMVVVIVVVNPPPPPPPECRLNSDCKAGKHCDGGICVADSPPPPECRLNSDCEVNQHCEGEICKDDPPPPDPTVTVTVNPTQVEKGGTVAVSWTSTNDTPMQCQHWSSPANSYWDTTDNWTGATKLKVTFVGGKEVTKSVTITVTDIPVAPLEIEVSAPAMDSVVHKGESVTFTVKIIGGKTPRAVNWFFFNGHSPSTSSTSNTVSISVVFDRVTPGIFPVDQYVQVVDWEGRVSAMVVVRIRVID